MRPFVDNVLQCYNCYKYGHLMKHCKVTLVCIVCRDAFHGKCERRFRCVNCEGGHRATSKACEIYQQNYELKKIMAINNVNVQEDNEE